MSMLTRHGMSCASTAPSTWSNAFIFARLGLGDVGSRHWRMASSSLRPASCAAHPLEVGVTNVRMRGSLSALFAHFAPNALNHG